MNNTWKVTSLETSKKLWELGLRVESETWWKIYKKNYNEAVLTRDKDYCYNNSEYTHFPALDCSELGVLLPKLVNIRHHECSLHYGVGGVNNKYSHVRYLGTQTNVSEVIADKYEAEARGLMLIWLIEQGYVSVEELNKVGL